MRAPTAWNFVGSLRKSLISCSSSIASSAPATSSKVTCGLSLLTSLAFDLPNCMTRLPPPCRLESRNQKMTPMMAKGMISPSRLVNQLVCGTSSSNSSRFAASTAATIASPRGAMYWNCTWVPRSSYSSLSTRSTRCSPSMIVALSTVEPSSSSRPSCVVIVRKPVEALKMLKPTQSSTIAMMMYGNGPLKMRLASKRLLVVAMGRGHTFRVKT